MCDEKLTSDTMFELGIEDAISTRLTWRDRLHRHFHFDSSLTASFFRSYAIPSFTEAHRRRKSRLVRGAMKGLKKHRHDSTTRCAKKYSRTFSWEKTKKNQTISRVASLLILKTRAWLLDLFLYLLHFTGELFFFKEY